MSSYLVDDACINRIVSYATTRAEQARPIPGLRSLGYDLTQPEHRPLFGRALFGLNIAAVEARYPESKAEKFRPLDYAYTVEPHTLTQASAAIHEWSYQCAEGDCPNDPLWIALQAVKPVVESEAKAEDQRNHKEALARKAAADEAAYQEGMAWLSEHQPMWAQAVIVAHDAVDESDMQTDYFNVRDGEPVILAWSKHTRDIFSELRKACKESRFSPVSHFITPPTRDRNGEERTEQNREWWHPCDEHREKYSMGAGYYLRAGHGGGWTVEKWTLSEWRTREIAIAIGRGAHTLKAS